MCWKWNSFSASVFLTFEVKSVLCVSPPRNLHSRDFRCNELVQDLHFQQASAKLGNILGACVILGKHSSSQTLRWQNRFAFTHVRYKGPSTPDRLSNNRRTRWIKIRFIETLDEFESSMRSRCSRLMIRSNRVYL